MRTKIGRRAWSRAAVVGVAATVTFGVAGAGIAAAYAGGEGGAATRISTPLDKVPPGIAPAPDANGDVIVGGKVQRASASGRDGQTVKPGDQVRTFPHPVAGPSPVTKPFSAPGPAE